MRHVRPLSSERHTPDFFGSGGAGVGDAAGLGLGGLLWLIPWFRYMPRHHSSVAAVPPEVPSVGEILSKRSAWGSFLGHFCGNYYWYFLLTWLPMWLVRDRGFSLDRMATVGSIVYGGIATATVIAGWVLISIVFVLEYKERGGE